LAEATVTIAGRKRPYWRVSPAFWTDEKVVEWDQDTRYLALYILTCPHRNLEGLFRLPKGYILDDLGWDADRLAEPFQQLLDEGFMEYDGRARLCLIVNALQYQAPDNEDHAKAGVKQLAELPKSGLFRRLLELAEVYRPVLAKVLLAQMPDRYPGGCGGGSTPRSGGGSRAQCGPPPAPISSLQSPTQPPDDTKPGGSRDVSSPEENPAEDAPVENPPDSGDDFADVDFGEEESEAAQRAPHPPQEHLPSTPAKKKPPPKGRSPSPEVLAALYHELCPSLPRVQKLKGTRRDRLKRACAQMGEEGLRAFFVRVEASDFLAGRVKGWRADLDWILEPKNMQRILEGVHDNRSPPSTSRRNVDQALDLVRRHELEEACGEAI